MKKSIFVKCVSVVLAVCFCFNFLSNDNIVYAADEADNAEYVQVYDEIGDEDGISPCSYLCKRTEYMKILKADDDSVVADIAVTITYEYADNSWVVVHDTNLRIQCYQGFLVSGNDDKVFGGMNSSYDYCRRWFLLKAPNGNIASAFLYAGADCYGDTYLEFAWDKIYILEYVVYEL